MSNTGPKDAETPHTEATAGGTGRKKAGTLALTAHGATGPRTKRGKRKSRSNAVRHGIFAVGFLRGRESRAEYNALVNDLADSLQPVGKIEEILVEKLAMTLWRHRRVLQAEAAEIARETYTIEDEELNGGAISRKTPVGNLGLIKGAMATHDEVSLAAAALLLEKLRDQIREKGLDWERDRNTLKSVYGTQSAREGLDEDPLGELADKYREIALSGKAQGAAAECKGEFTELIVGLVEEEIQRLEQLFDEWNSRAMERLKLQKTTVLVPQQQVADRLLRYEGALDRAFDRTLAQLERLQRLRSGQPTPPPLNINVSR